GAVKCMREGKEEAILHAETTRYRLVITGSGDGRGGFVIKPECWSGTYSFQPSRKIVSFIKSVESGIVPASIRTRKRRPVLYDALFKTLAAANRKQASEALKSTIDETTF